MTEGVDHFLVPVDFSSVSIAAVERGLALAQHLDASATLLSVIHPRELHAVQFLRRTDDAAEALSDRLERALSEAVAESLARGLSVDTEVREGEPTDEVLRIAQERGTNLIVLGQGAVDRDPRFLLGDTTYSIVRNAPCSVLVEPGGQQPASSGPILVPLDLGDQSAAVVAWANRLSAAVDLPLVLLHVSGSRSAPEAEIREEMLSLARATDAAARVERVDVVKGTAATCIAEASSSASMVVLGSRDRGGLVRRFWLGGTVYKVVRTLRCPVLVVRSS